MAPTTSFRADLFWPKHVAPKHGPKHVVGTLARGYHPLFCFNQFGDLERAMLRNGNVHSADDWRSLMEPVVARYREGKIRRFFRGDAAFANPDIYTFLEQEGRRNVDMDEFSRETRKVVWYHRAEARRKW